MPSEIPTVEHALTRRSSRLAAASSDAAPATPQGLTRAELRRRGARVVEAAVESDAVPLAPATVEAAPAETAPVEAVASAAPLTRRRARTAALVLDATTPVVEVEVATVPEVAPELLAAPARVAAPVDDITAFELQSPRTGAEASDPLRVAAEAFDADDEPAPVVDEFAAAARLFSFTGETPVIAPTPVEVAASALADEPAAAAPVRRWRRPSVARVAATSFSLGVIGVVGVLTVGMTTPSLAAAAPADGTPLTTSLVAAGGDVAADEDGIQAYVAPAQAQADDLHRDGTYSTTTRAEIAAESGISNFSDFFTNDPNAAIQWPFAVGVPITYGFGVRSGTLHEGVDFVPGAGSPIQAIADGTVRIATESGGAYGVTVVIDHVIDGELVSSRYAHMQYGSLQVEAGQQVTVGTVLGRTGNTGRSFGAHTHFEILIGGTTAIDPLPWLREHAGG